MTQPQQSQGKPLIEVLADWLCPDCGTPVYGERCSTCGNDRNLKKADWPCGCGNVAPAEAERCPVCGNRRGYADATIGDIPMPTWRESRGSAGTVPKCSRCGGDAIPGDPGAYFDEDDNVRYCSECVEKVANE